MHSLNGSNRLDYFQQSKKKRNSVLETITMTSKETLIIKALQENQGRVKQKANQHIKPLFDQLNTAIQLPSPKIDDKESDNIPIASNQSSNILKFMRQLQDDRSLATTGETQFKLFKFNHVSDSISTAIQQELKFISREKQQNENKKRKITSATAIINIVSIVTQQIITNTLKTIKKYLEKKTKPKRYYFKRSVSEQIINGLEINNHICIIVDHNDALLSSYAHFHILLYLSNSEILSCYEGKNQLLLTVNSYIIQHLQKPQIRQQLTEMSYYTVMSYLVGIRKRNRTQIIAFMRNFIRQNRQILMGVCPYYYNLFSLVVNKPIVFEEKQPNIQNLMEYTVQFNHTKFYSGRFSRADIIKELRELQTMIIRKYHSGEE